MFEQYEYKLPGDDNSLKSSSIFSKLQSKILQSIYQTKMATEVAVFTLLDGKRPDDANSDAGRIWKETLETLTEQKGFQNAYWGREVENPDRLRLFVDWASVEAHINFTKTEYDNPPKIKWLETDFAQYLQTFPRTLRRDSRHQERCYHVSCKSCSTSTYRSPE